jgi:hypothetical protein
MCQFQTIRQLIKAIFLEINKKIISYGEKVGSGQDSALEIIMGRNHPNKAGSTPLSG